MNRKNELETILFFLKEWLDDLESHLVYAKMALENLRRRIRDLEELINEVCEE